MNNILHEITKKYDYMLNQLFIVLENVKTNESSNQPGKQQPLVPMDIKGVQDTSKKLLDSSTNGWLPECIDNIEPQRETDFKMTKEKASPSETFWMAPHKPTSSSLYGCTHHVWF